MSRNTILYNVYNDTVITKDTSLECVNIFISTVHVSMPYIWNIKTMVHFLPKQMFYDIKESQHQKKFTTLSANQR